MRQLGSDPCLRPIGSPPAPGRSSWSARRTGALAVAGVVLVAPLPAAAATATRTEDQRLARAETTYDQHGHFGSTLAMSRGPNVGSVALVAAPHAGVTGGGILYRFTYDGTSWTWNLSQGPSPTSSPRPFPMDHHLGTVLTSQRKLDQPTSFLWYSAVGNGTLFDRTFAVEVKALTYRDSLVAVGLPDAFQTTGAVYFFAKDGAGNWQYAGGFVGASIGDRLGSALAAKDGMVVAGAPGYGANGAVYLFVCCGPQGWVEWQRLDSPAVSQTGAQFGAALDVASDGSWIAVGSPLVDRVTSPGALVDVGAVYLFEHVDLSWELATLLRPPGAGDGDRFGTSVAMHRKFLVAGSPGEDDAAEDEGAAYVYHLSGTQWETLPRLRLVDSAGGEGDALGTSVGAGDEGVLVGAPHFDANGLLDSGAALFYRHAGAFFADGFEAGNTSAWSMTVP